MTDPRTRPPRWANSNVWSSAQIALCRTSGAPDRGAERRCNRVCAGLSVAQGYVR